MSDHVPCPLCGNGKLNEAPSPAAIDDAVRNYVTIPRAQHEALMAAAKEFLVEFPDDPISVALRAAGIMEEKT